MLELENAELKARLNSNSENSSRPPSSDGYQKKPAFPKKKNGKQGGQPGHKGSTLHQVDNPDKIVSCKPNSCSCGHGFKEEELILSEKRQVFDLPKPKLEITEYQIHKAVCPEYIVVHELVHLLERSHNENFIRYMNDFMPKWRFYRDELNRLPFRHTEWKY